MLLLLACGPEPLPGRSPDSANLGPQETASASCEPDGNVLRDRCRFRAQPAAEVAISYVDSVQPVREVEGRGDGEDLDQSLLYLTPRTDYTFDVRALDGRRHATGAFTTGALVGGADASPR
ncbi:MAG: hypothetical protein ABMB14_18600 [Myxococcota bacterium]